MSDSQTISWIFLAIAMASQVEPANFNGISMIADGINHAVPTQKELQTSIRWLIDNDLLSKLNNKYSLTAIGQRVYNDAQNNSAFVSETWSNLEKEIEKFK